MAALVLDTDFFVKSDLPNCSFKTLLVSTVTTADSSDTLTVDLSKYGGGQLMGVYGFTHTTANSVVIQEQPTTSVSGSTLTITIGGASSDQARHFVIFLTSGKNP